MGILVGGDKKVPSVARLYPQELESTPATRERFLEEFLEFIIKTYCTLVGLGARFCCNVQRF
jgi:hypothetical protein